MEVSSAFKNGFILQYWLKPLTSFNNYVYPFVLEKTSGTYGPMKITIGMKTDPNQTYYLQLYMSSAYGTVYNRINMPDVNDTLFSGTNMIDEKRYMYHQISVFRPNDILDSGSINMRVGFVDDYIDRYVESSKSFDTEIVYPFSDPSGSEIYIWKIGAMSSTPCNNVYSLYNFRIWGESGSITEFIDISGTIDEIKFDYFMELPETVYMKDMNAYNYLIGWYKLDGNRYISGSIEYMYNTAPSGIIGNLSLQHSGSNIWTKDKIISYRVPIKKQRRTESSKIRWKDNEIEAFVDNRNVKILGAPSKIFDDEFMKYFAKNQLNIVGNRDELLYSSSFVGLKNIRDNISEIFNFQEDFFDYSKYKNIFRKIFNFLPDFLNQFIPERVITEIGLLIANTFYNLKKWPLNKPEFSIPKFDNTMLFDNIQEIVVNKTDENIMLYNILPEINSYKTSEMVYIDTVRPEIKSVYSQFSNSINIQMIEGTADIINTATMEANCFGKINRYTINPNAVERKEAKNIFVKDLKTIE